MALSKEIMGGGFSAGQATALGGGYAAITAVGSTQADAATLTASNCMVTGANGTTGVILSGNVGDSVLVFNNTASTCKVWPSVGSAISVAGTGLGTANVAFSLTTYKPATFIKITATQWIGDVGA